MRRFATLLATALALAASGQAQILPAGEFSAIDGRPGPGKTWKLSDAQGQALAAQLNTIAARSPIAIDYEHQTMLAKTNGQPAPAAGYMQRFDWRPGEGLFADVQWTERAAAYLKAGEYRYISPVLLYDDTGTVFGIYNAALVSTPGLVGMQPVTLSAALSALGGAIPSDLFPEAKKMDLKELLALLGLPETGTAADCSAAISALKAKGAAACSAALATALGLQTGADEAAALAAVGKLKAPDATTLTTIAALQAQVAALASAQAEDKVTKAVEQAITVDHKLLPAQRDWALSLGRKDFAALSAYLASAPVMSGLGGQLTDAQRQGDPAKGAAGLSAQQVQIAAALGLSADRYAKHLADAAA